MDNTFTVFNIELTNHCVMKCVMCPRTNNMTRPLGFMDFNIFAKAIDEIHAYRPDGNDAETLWLHHFGESLLHPEFDRCIAYAEERHIRTGLSINPIMLTGKVADRLIAARPRVLYISLDGHDDESFHEIRGMKNAYLKSRERLIEFLNKKTTSISQTAIILSMVDFNLNHDSIERTREYWESVKGIDSFLTKSFTTWDGAASDINALAGNESGQTFDMSAVQCRWPFERMTITWDGDVVPCCFDYNKKYILGSLRSSTLAEIWNDVPIERLRKEFMTNNVVNPLCKNCRRLYMPADMVEL